jgi:hypothetical protein
MKIKKYVTERYSLPKPIFLSQLNASYKLRPQVYIYKEPGNTKLFEITDRLRKTYAKQFGHADSVEILRESRKPHELKLDTAAKNYIQVVHVQPFFGKEELAERASFFDRNNNLNRCFYLNHVLSFTQPPRRKFLRSNVLFIMFIETSFRFMSNHHQVKKLIILSK